MSPSNHSTTKTDLGTSKDVSQLDSYWNGVRSAPAALFFVLPMTFVYESAIAAHGGDSTLRTGTDAWVGILGTRYAIPEWTASVALSFIILIRAFAARPRPIFRPRWLTGMGFESLILGLGLLGIYFVFDQLTLQLDQQVLLSSDLSGTNRLIGLLGAGLFEEFLFRLILFSGVESLLSWLRVPKVASVLVASCSSALLFASAHNFGMTPEDFDCFLFTFRTLAGLYFAAVYQIRGFGVVVGTHVAYDFIVAAVFGLP